MARLTIPQRICLPFGYIVTVKQVPPTDPALHDTETGETLDGSWNSDTRVIAINKTLPMRRRRILLYHELQHGIADAQHHFLNEGIMHS